MLNMRKLFYQDIFFVLTLLSVPCSSDIIVFRKGSNKTIEIIGDLPALFGPSLPITGLKGYIVFTSPPDACVPPAPPPKLVNYNEPFIALVRRYNCSFVDKVLNAQIQGYKAVIVRNVGSNSVEVMNGDHDIDKLRIPSVFIGEDDGLLLQTHFQYNSGYYVVLTEGLPFNIQNYLLPFAITIGVCFVLMLTLMLVKCIRDYKKTRRHRLSSKALKKLPLQKFRKGDPYDCCAICLEDFIENDKLRILPCDHAYHSKCIDPWLTKNRRVCPVCKRKVITGDEQPSDLESDSDDETAPLINSNAGTQGGTFIHQRENPFHSAQRAADTRDSISEGREYTREGRDSYERLLEEDSESEGENALSRRTCSHLDDKCTQSREEEEEEKTTALGQNQADSEVVPVLRTLVNGKWEDACSNPAATTSGSFKS